MLCYNLWVKANKKNSEIALDLLELERVGRLSQALNLLHPEYSMTWVYRHPKNGCLFPRHKGVNPADFEEIYQVEGREYNIKNISEHENTVFIELVESYPDTERAGFSFRTPEVIVLEFKDGLVVKGRHYCDPNISYEGLSVEQVEKAFL